MWIALTLLTAASCVAAAPTFTYDADLKTVFGALAYGDLQPAAANGLALGKFHMSMFQAPPARMTSAYTALVAAAAPLCLASHASGVTDVTLSDVADILTGKKTVAFRVILGSTKVSPSSHELLLSLNDRGVSGFQSTDEWPSAVLSNPNIVWVQNDTQLSSYISQHTLTVGPQASMMAFAAPVACLRIRLTTVSGDNVAYSQQPTASTISHMVVKTAQGRVTTQGAVYPLMGALILSAPINTTCTELDQLRGFLEYLFNDGNVSSIFAGRNIVSFDNVDQFRILVNLASLISSACGSTDLSFDAYGDMSAYDGIANVALAYSGGLPSFGTYNGNANVSSLLDALNDGDLSVAVLDNPGVSQLTPYVGTILIAPVFALSMALVYNLEGYDALSASPCTMYGLLNGSITWWDDNMVLADNIGVSIPHVRVTPLITPSSTTRSLIAGLNSLYQMCFGSSSPISFDVSGAWPFANTDDYNYIDAYSTVESVYGSFAFVPTPTAIDRGMRMMPLQLASGAQLAASKATTSRTIASYATVDATTNVAVPSLQGRSVYPFVSITHIAIRASYTTTKSNCTQVAAMVNFLEFLAGQQGSIVLSGLGFTLLSDAWRASQSGTPLQTLLSQVTCGGNLVLPPVNPLAPQTATDISGPVIGSVFGVVALLVFLAALKLLRTRSHRAAPKDEVEPFAIVFTDVQSSTALWANAPLEMGPALEQHHALMREAIAATDGYEVKTIGDSFMVAYRTAQQAIQFGMMVQQLFQDAEWPQTFDDFYRDEAERKDDVTAEVRAQYVSQNDKPLWHGMRVRIGVHYGHGQIKLDPVTQAYDYYGTVVNTAARVEAVGHGGQVCVTAAALEAAGLTAASSSDCDVSIRDLGLQELYGLSEAVHLYQILPSTLGARLFPPLRSHHGSDERDEEEAEAADGIVIQEDGNRASASSASDVDDDVEVFFDKAVARLDHRLSADALISYYAFVCAMAKVEKKGQREAPIQRLLGLWGVTGVPVNHSERRLVYATNPSTLYYCRFVLRVATAMPRMPRIDKPPREGKMEDTVRRLGDGLSSSHTESTAGCGEPKSPGVEVAGAGGDDPKPAAATTSFPGIIESG